MSETELHTGRLRKVVGIKDVEAFCQKIMTESGYAELGGHCDNWVEYLREMSYEDDKLGKIKILNDEVWELLEHEEHEDLYVAEGKPQADGTITFTACFYNGGTYLDEMLEDIVKKIK